MGCMEYEFESRPTVLDSLVQGVCKIPVSRRLEGRKEGPTNGS